MWLFRIFSVSFLCFHWIFVGMLQRVSQELPWGPSAFLRPSSPSLIKAISWSNSEVKSALLCRVTLERTTAFSLKQSEGFLNKDEHHFKKYRVLPWGYSEGWHRSVADLEFPEIIQQSSCQNSEEFMRKTRGRPTKRVWASSHTDTFWVYSVSFLVKELFKSLRISLGQFGSLVRVTYQSRSVEFWDCTETIGSGTLLELLND